MANDQTNAGQTMAILVGGGPAPGINGVISAATIEAIRNGWKVLGVYDGFKWLAKGDASQVRELTIEEVSRIHFDGGSILRTSRENPTKDETKMQNVIQALQQLRVRHLVTIGGDDTAYSASQLAKRTQNQISVMHVPKTIDNDLPLPGGMPTFGFQTARHVGVSLVQNIMEDSKTTGRWYFVVAMGRKAGHLALGIGKAAGATLTIIGEEFPEKTITVKQIADILEGAILKRRAAGRNDGVAVLAEGLAEKMSEEELKTIPGIHLERDEHDHIRLAEIDLGKMMKRVIERRFSERGDKITIVDITIGYELRCAPPIPFDCEYTRDLGYGAVRHLIEHCGKDNPGAMVCLHEGRIKPIPFTEMLDPQTGKTQVRLVDINTESYAVARKYMIRLEKEDLTDDARLAAIAKAGKMTPEAVKEKFGPMVGL